MKEWHRQRVLLARLAGAAGVGVILAAFILAGPILTSAADGEVTAAPGVFLAASVLDLGQVKRGATTHAEIELRNRGSHTYDLESASANCGCAAVVPQHRRLPPGGRLTVNVSVDSSSFTGPTFGKLVVLRLTEGDSRHDIRVAVRGTVSISTWLVALPARIDFEHVSPGKQVERAIHLVGPVEILDRVPGLITLGADDVETVRVHCESEPASSAPRGTKSVRIVLNVPSTIDSGSFDRVMNIQLHGAISQDLTLPIHAVVRPMKTASFDLLLK